MAIAVFTTLLKRISSLVQQASSSSREPPSSAEEQLHDLADTMKRIHAVLDDAEEKDISDKSEQLRLRELKEVAYDAEDAIDEYEYQVLRAKVEARRQAKAGRMNNSNHADEVIFDWNSYHPKISVSNELTSRVQEIRERFENITEDWNRISLREKDGKRRRCVKKWKPTETTSCFDDSKTFGRQGEKEEIINWLLEGPNRSDEGRVSVLPVVGMGGLGKTTLAQMVYHDPRVCQHFDLKGWVCVSEDFNVENLLIRICTSFNMVVSSHMSLSKIGETLKKKLKGREFFLVLDDVWNQSFDLWNSLKSFLVDAGAGKILMTTRNESVAKIMQTASSFKLQTLSFDNCWSLFSKIYFETRGYKLNEKFQDMGKKIVKKCGGLPLAVKVLASFLSVEADEESWIEILDSELWELNEENDGVMPALKLSYVHMPIELRPCFMYLSLFPKDSALKQATIVQQWMAHGFLGPNGKKREEDVGNDYFKQLLHRSILQHHNDNRRKFMMHDLIHDLAQDVAKAEYLLISTDKLCDHMIPKTIRHLSISVKENFQIKDFEPLLETKLGLRTLMFHSVREFPADSLMPYVMHNLRNLRTLSFPVIQVKEKSITLGFVDSLKYLRYLVTNMYIPDIPESLYNLYFLQTLDLRFCSVNLSGRVVDLVNLRNFNVGPLCGMPHEVSELTHLQKLRHFVLGPEAWKCKLRHLNELPNLRGKLHISGLETIVPSDFTPSETYLKTRTGMVELVLIWHFLVDHDEKWATQVLECLRPHPNIKSMGIDGYRGAVLPMWLGSFSKLEQLYLSSRNITSVPTLGQLPRLKNLWIGRMKRVKTIGRELLCSSSPVINPARQDVKRGGYFPSLERLHFDDNVEWEEWHGVEDSDFPRLRHLYFHECPELPTFPHLPALGKLTISRCPKLRLPALPSVTTLQVANGWNPEVVSGDCLPMLQDLDIRELKDESFVFHDSQILHSIKKLRILNCEGLRSVAGLGNLYSLQSLDIYKCRQLQFSPNERLPPNLQDVQIHQSPSARSWYHHQISKGSADRQMDPESDQEEEDSAFECSSMNSESEQDEDSSFMEAGMDPESEQEDDFYGVEAMSLNSDSEQDEDSSSIEADVSALNI